MNTSLPAGSSWMAATAPEVASARGARNSGLRAGSVPDAAGVDGTGSAKTLIHAWSGAVKKRVIGELSEVSSEYMRIHGGMRHTAMELTERSQCWVRVKRTSFAMS